MGCISVCPCCLRLPNIIQYLPISLPIAERNLSFQPSWTASARQIKTKYESTSLFWKHLKTTRNIFFVADQKTRLQKKTAHLNAMVAQPLLTCHPRACIARKRSGYQRSPAITSGPGEPWWVVTQAWHPRIWVTLEETHGKQLFVWVATVLSVSLSLSHSLSESFFCSFSLSLFSLSGIYHGNLNSFRFLKC